MQLIGGRGELDCESSLDFLGGANRTRDQLTGYIDATIRYDQSQHDTYMSDDAEALPIFENAR